MMRRILWTSLVAGAALSIAASAAVAAGRLTIGSVEGGWVYPYVQPFALPVLGVAGAAIAAAAVLLRLTLRSARPWPSVFAWIAFATLFQAALRPLAPFSFDALLTSPGAHGFYTLAERHRPGEVLRHFNRVRAQAPLHAQSNMPGKVLLVHALRLVTTDPSTLAWLLVIAANLGAIFMFLFARGVFDDEGVGVLAAVFYLFTPARNFFLPLMNPITPAVVLACGWLLMRWLKAGRTADAALMGAALYALVLFEPLPLVVGLLFAGLAVRAIVLGTITWARFIPQAALAIATLIAISETVHAVFGFELVAAFRRIGAHATEFNVQAGRPYGVWVRANLWELALGAGLCQVAAWVGAWAAGLREVRQCRDRAASAVVVYCAGLAAVIVATDLIGINRGEVSRLWIFLACFLQMPAAWVCSRLASPLAASAVLATSILFIALGSARIGFVIP